MFGIAVMRVCVGLEPCRLYGALTNASWYVTVITAAERGVEVTSLF